MKKINTNWLVVAILSVVCLFVAIRFIVVFQKDDIQNQPLTIKGVVPEMKEKNYSLSLLMAGDALYHDGVYKDGLKSGVYDFRNQLSMIKPIVEPYDLAYYNQESILGGTELGLSTYPRFNSPYEVGDAFVDAGFNLISTANNHTLDRGEQAIINSTNYWKTKDVGMSGSCDTSNCNRFFVSEKNHIRYAFLSYTTTTNGLTIPKGKEYLVNLYDDSVVEKDIASVKDSVDVILVAMHWGNEYQNDASSEQKRIAKYLASLGVTIVIGNHPHVIEPIEKIGDTLVFYSLGNFISAQTGIDKLIGMMASLNINLSILGDTRKITLDSLKVELTYTSYNKQFRDFKIIPFSSLDSSILMNYQKLEKEKRSLLASYGVTEISES